MFRRFIAPVLSASFLMTLAALPANADPLPERWQSKRDDANWLSDKACRGEESAIELVWYEVEEGNPVILNNINWLRKNCAGFSEVSGEDAMEYMRQAAESGYPIAQRNLGREMLAHGRYGVALDAERGAELLERAARGGYGLSAVDLAEFYIEGKHLPRNPEKAGELLDIAEREGVDPEEFEWMRKEISLARTKENSGPAEPSARASLSAETVFADLKEEFGADYGPVTGYLADADVYYFHYCSATSFGRLAVFRLQNDGSAQIWSDEKACVNGIDTADLDQDGEPEIRYYTQGGGSGTFAAMVTFLHWPTDAPEPKKGLKYTTYSHSSWDGLFSRYGYDSPGFSLMVSTTSELVEGPSCKWDEYCPSWPKDAQCRAAIKCPLVVEKSLFVQNQDTEYPDRLRGDREWERFVQDVYEGEGYRLANKGAPEGLVSASLSPLERVLDAAAGEAPGEVSEARKDLISDWLN